MSKHDDGVSSRHFVLPRGKSTAKRQVDSEHIKKVSAHEISTRNERLILGASREATADIVEGQQVLERLEVLAKVLVVHVGHVPRLHDVRRGGCASQRQDL